jgi:hypothetical protein
MVVIALPFLIVATICWWLAGRIDTQRKIKGWSGERTTFDEVKTARSQIMALRIATGVCIALAILGVAGMNLLSAYHAYGVR